MHNTPQIPRLTHLIPEKWPPSIQPAFPNQAVNPRSRPIAISIRASLTGSLARGCLSQTLSSFGGTRVCCCCCCRTIRHERDGGSRQERERRNTCRTNMYRGSLAKWNGGERELCRWPRARFNTPGGHSASAWRRCSGLPVGPGLSEQPYPPAPQIRVVRCARYSRTCVCKERERGRMREKPMKEARRTKMEMRRRRFVVYVWESFSKVWIFDKGFAWIYGMNLNLQDEKCWDILNKLLCVSEFCSLFIFTLVRNISNFVLL